MRGDWRLAFTIHFTKLYCWRGWDSPLLWQADRCSQHKSSAMRADRPIACSRSN